MTDGFVPLESPSALTTQEVSHIYNHGRTQTPKSKRHPSALLQILQFRCKQILIVRATGKESPIHLKSRHHAPPIIHAQNQRLSLFRCIYVDVLMGNALLVQEPERPAAVRTPTGNVSFHCSHRVQVSHSSFTHL
jgi:hypothetical protein